MSEMSKYVKMFMEDHDLKVGDEFTVHGDDVAIWHFTADGYMENQVGFRNNKLLTGLLLGAYEVGENITKEPWKPELYDIYWFISQYGNVSHNSNDNDEQDKYMFAHYPIFRTKEDAEDYRWFIDKVDEYKRPFEQEEDNHYFYYNYEEERIEVTCDQHCQYQGTIYFGDEDNINEFLDEVGEKRIQKYWFNV